MLDILVTFPQMQDRVNGVRRETHDNRFLLKSSGWLALVVTEKIAVLSQSTTSIHR